MVDITDDVKELLKYTDLVLLDIKHIDSDKSKKLVGFGNEKELNFARFLSDNNIDMWIRQVIIPGITDDEDDLKKLRDFISSLKTVRKIEFLKYHLYIIYIKTKIKQKKTFTNIYIKCIIYYTVNVDCCTCL